MIDRITALQTTRNWIALTAPSVITQITYTARVTPNATSRPITPRYHSPCAHEAFLLLLRNAINDGLCLLNPDVVNCPGKRTESTLQRTRPFPDVVNGNVAGSVTHGIANHEAREKRVSW